MVASINEVVRPTRHETCRSTGPAIAPFSGRPLLVCETMGATGVVETRVWTGVGNSHGHMGTEPLENGLSEVRAEGAGPRRRLAAFTGSGYDKGRPLAVCAIWVLLIEPLQRTVWCPARLRAAILRLFGARIGPGVLIRHDVHIHWPWKLSIGPNSWVGVGTRLLNLEDIFIGSNVCISQDTLLCTGSHHADDPAFEFDNAPIRIEDGAWVATRATVLRGVTIGKGALVGATALVTKDVPAGVRVLAPRAETTGVQ